MTTSRQIEAMQKFREMQQRSIPATARVSQTIPVVRETVRVTPVSNAAYLMKPDESWSWEDLRDYVMGQIVEFHGPQVRNTMKEASIFKGFMSRHGSAAVGIARFAFEQQRGMWQRAPIAVNRFCRGSDPYFADIISDRL